MEVTVQQSLTTGNHRDDGKNYLCGGVGPGTGIKAGVRTGGVTVKKDN